MHLYFHQVVTRFLYQAVSALTEAHQSGIVHRGIKPDDKMIRAGGLVKILNFGLAKPIETRNAKPEIRRFRSRENPQTSAKSAKS